MMKRFTVILALLCAAPFCRGTGELDPAEVAERFARMYVAPMDGGGFWRMYEPGTGMVEFRAVSGGRELRGAADWRGSRDGDVVTVVSPVEGAGAVSYTFRKGRPETFTVDGTKFGVQVEDGEVTYPGPVPAIWDEDASQEDDPLAGKWGGRFTLFYRNPNHFGCLVASLALAALASLLFASRLKVVSGIALVVLAVSLFLSGARGAMLGFGAGAAFIVVSWLFRRGVPKVKVLAGCAVAIGLVAAAMVLSGLADSWLNFPGNSLRIELWKTAPRMMFDAPGGWGAFTRAGDAYMDWYQPLSSPDLLWTLVSAHLTTLVSIGWVWRIVWCFAWFAVLAILARTGLRGGNPLPCAVWAAFFVAALFNPVLTVWSLWVPAIAVLVWWGMAEKPWKTPKSHVWPAAGAAVAALAVVAVFYAAGASAQNDASVPVRLVGSRVVVNGDDADAWILDDGRTLGWQRAPREIRFFCESVSGEPSIGYARGLEALPRSMRRLVVAGDMCRAYIDAWMANTAPSAREIVFISPGFAPAFVPDGLRRQSKVFIVVGEFAARYSDVYGEGELPDWVGVSPGAEVYIPGWVSFAM